MSKLTKVLALALVAIFALSLVACGGDKEGNESGKTTKAPVGNAITTAQGITTTTTAAQTDKNGKTKKQDNTTAKDITTTIAPVDSLIARTTNRAGNASNKFIKSLKGFTLKILYPWENIYGDKKCQASAEESIKAVEKLYGVKIKEDGQFSKYNETLSNELAAKKCANHIYYAQGEYFASYFQKNYIADLTPAMRETGVDFNAPWYISEAKGFLNIDGKQYGWIPYEDEYTMPFCIIYNKTLLSKKKLGDPATLAKQGKWTWDTIRKYSKMFDNDSATGFVVPSENIVMFEAIANQYGTSLTKVSRGTTPTTNISDSRVKQALIELSNWTTGSKPWAETFVGQQWNYAKNQLAQGKVAMYFGTHDDIQNLAGTSVRNNIGIAPFPTKNGSKSYTNISLPQFVAFIPSLHQANAAKILFIRDEYYRYNYRYANRNFQYKWKNYLGSNEAIANAANIKFASGGNKIVFSWTLLCESKDSKVKTSSIMGDVLRGSKSPAESIASKKNALTQAYSKVWGGHKTTGNV